MSATTITDHQRSHHLHHSIINDNATFSHSNAVIHQLHQQFRIVDPEYATFLDLIRFIRPTQEQVDNMQHGIVLCPEGQLTDRQIWTAFQSHPNSSIMTVSRKGAQRIKTIVVHQLFQGRPLSNIPCACVVDSDPIYPHGNMRVIFTKNRDKGGTCGQRSNRRPLCTRKTIPSSRVCPKDNRFSSNLSLTWRMTC